MTPHLLPEEFVDAADGTLDASRAAHLDACGACAAELESLRRTQREIERAGGVPDPSPLFWDHLSARVHDATSGHARDERWRIGWRSTIGFAAIAAAVLLAIVMRPSDPAPPGTIIAVATPGEPADIWLPALDDGSFDVVLEMASTLEWDEVRQVAAPRAATVDALIQELSPAEREALVRLLRSEIGELE